MSKQLSPIFPVASPSSKSMEGNLTALATVCHVVESQGAFALVHASPMGVARIASDLGLEVYPSKRGGEYYAVRVGKVAVRAIPQARPAPAAGRMTIGGAAYTVKETTPKRRCDVRRWEVRKADDQYAETYVVTFQSADGAQTACSCKGGIYRKECKHMDALRAAFGGRVQTAAARVA
jgi:hypothetical protein